MANKIFLGTLETQARIVDVTPANVEIGDVFTVVITNHRGQSITLSFTATAATVKNVVDAMTILGTANVTAALAIWEDFAFSDDDTKLTITGTAGYPFSVACTAVNVDGGADTQTLVATEAQTVEGPGLLYLSENYLNDSGLRTWTCGITPDNVEVDDVFAITLTDPTLGNSYPISFTASAATVQNVVEGLQAAAAAAKSASHAPWTLVTATEDDATLTLTLDAEGPALDVSATATNGASTDDQTLTVSYPDTGDTLIISRLCEAGLHGGEYQAWPLAEFREESGYEPDVETGDYACGAALQPLHIDAEEFDYAGGGEQFIELDNCTLAVVQSATASQSDGEYGLHLTGTGNTKLMTRMSAGNVGVAMNAGETAAFATIDAGGGVIDIGENVTCTTLDVSAGTATSWCDLTTVHWYGGDYNREGGTLTNYYGYAEGAAVSNSNGTITETILAGGSVLNLTRTRPVTLSSVTANGKEAGLWFPFGNVTLAAGVDCPNCGFNDLSMRTPPGFKWSQGAIV